MSGDVQPRKRKDNKKKRKEDGDGLLTTSLSSSSNNEDTQTIIHVHKDGGTGGNICAKIVFFLLFSALIVLIGLIIKENQGLNELENVDSSESRFSQIFEGWTDKTVDEHDDHHHASPEELSDELHDDDDDDDLHEEEEEESEENENAAEEDHSEEVSEEAQNEEESNEIEEEETSQTEEDDEESDEEEVELSEEKNDDESQQQDEHEAEEDQDEEIKENDEDSVEQIENKKDSDEINQEDKKLKKPSSSIAEEPSSTKESSGLTTKIGVGLSLLIVAYKVFFRKRRTDNAVENSTKMVQHAKDSSSALDLMNRRNTIIPPPSLQEIEQDLPEADVNNDDEEYSEEDNDDDEEKDQHEGVHHFTPKEEYQELRKTYTRSLTPEGEFEPGIKRFEDDEENAEEADIDEEEDENDNYDEDEELLKRLEAKYGKLGRDVNVVEEQEEQHEIRISDDSEKDDDDDDDYEHADITNVDDYLIKDEIDTANQHLINKNVAYANKLFETLLEKYPQSPRIIYGKGLVLDKLADQEKSNELLNKALNYYLQALNAPNVPDKLFINIAERFIDRAHFLGQYKKAIGVHWNLIERFPDNSIFYNRLAVTYLTINLAEEARMVLQKVLTKWPNNGFALVHYGFILKTVDNKLEKSIEFMSKGLKTREKGVIDGRFYFHLGDALARLNRNKEAEQLYIEGVKEKVFKSIYQRSLYNVDRLTARSWWKLEDIPQYRSLFSELINNYGKIREEGLNVLNTKGYFKDEAENLKDTGEWKQFELFARGQKSVKNCNKCPVTCSIIEKFSYASACKRGQTKFSVMHPGTHVWPHCGPTNCRLRIHLGLKVPANTFIRVAKEIRSWKDGDLLIFDDSFEHEVWHNGSEFRLVLIVDVWHPELTPTEKRSLSPI